MLKNFSVFILIFLIMNYVHIKAFGNNSLEISNKYFSFAMPSETKDTYTIDKSDNSIFICEKISKKNDFGGFAFGFKIFKNPGDYADIIGSKKIGELTDTKGIIYDMVLMRPTEIQYGDGKETKENYTRLYNLAENIKIKGINGKKYVKNQGMKGEELYSSILQNYNKK